VDPINWHTFFFLLTALTACAFAVAMVVSGNIVRMAFYLVISLGAVSGLFFLAGADFLGAMQLMIYVGGTLVLLAFGVMLTAGGPLVSMKTGAGQWVLAAVVGGSLLAVLLQTSASMIGTAATSPSRTRPWRPRPPQIRSGWGWSACGSISWTKTIPSCSRGCPDTCCRSRSSPCTWSWSWWGPLTSPGRNDAERCGAHRRIACRKRRPGMQPNDANRCTHTRHYFSEDQ
jgi:NADH:ubiquinone oxidoreductase subunit 6 (subunit J)